ncbi:MAG TPA: indole-3-glycerol phosphate synthase TrpC [Chthoniobacterales bacterium]|jgi:indole-3-glycerol phosphate synthase
MDRLRQILATKEEEVRKILYRQDHLRAAALARNDFRPFAAAVHQGEHSLGLIAEVKKASPSAGVIAENFDPVQIAKAYESAGAHALSVLTDEQYFQGHLRYLMEIRQATTIPVLRKDFIIHQVQIFEAAVAGADAILLIVAALTQDDLLHLLDVAETCQLDVLVEVHDEEEMERALETPATLIGINNRNLRTFQVDLATTERLSEEVPEHITLISESGIKTNADARRVFTAGINGLLVGETLMRCDDVHETVADLLNVE